MPETDRPLDLTWLKRGEGKMVRLESIVSRACAKGLAIMGVGMYGVMGMYVTMRFVWDFYDYDCDCD